MSPRSPSRAPRSCSRAQPSPPARSSSRAAVPGEDGGSFATLHGLYWLTLNLAGDNPLLLAIDDLHWCDRPSLRFIAYLARRLEGTPVLIAATLRSTEPGTDPVLISEIAGDPLARSISPAPLTEAAVHSVVSERLGGSPDKPFVHACHEATGGNPLLLRELLSALAAEGVEPRADRADLVGEIGPRAVSRSVLLRLSRLSPEAAATARAAAVLGKAGDIAHVAELAGLAEADVASATGELARAEILLGEVPLRFVHPLIREAIYLDIAPGDRQLQHARAAELLTAVGRRARGGGHPPAPHAAPGEPATVELLAGAAALSRPQGRARQRRGLPAPSHRRAAAGRRASARSASSSASRRRSWSRPRRSRRSTARARRAMTRPCGPSPPSVQAPIMILTGSPTAGRDLARDVAAELPPEMENERRALESIAFSAPQFAAGAPGDSEDLEPHRKLPLPPGGGAKMLASIASLRWAHAGGSADECSELALAALEGDEMMELDGGFVAVCAHQVLAMAGREEVMPALEELNDLGHSRGSIFLMSGVQLFRGIALRFRGDLAAAEETLREGAEYFDRWGFAVVFFRAFLASTLLARGDVAGAREQLDKTGDLGDWSEGARFWLHTHLETMLEEGRYEEVLAGAEDFSERFAHLRTPSSAAGAPCAPAPWTGSDGPTRSRGCSTRNSSGRAAGERRARSARRCASAASCEGPRAPRTWRRRSPCSRARPHASSWRSPSPRWARSLRLDRHPADARDPLRRALELATACSADGLVEHCRTELAAAGARPRREALSGVASLTPSERRVADLAMGAMTNREIAQTLYVTPKTVEVHLSNAYRKLDIRSRRELPQVLSPA